MKRFALCLALLAGCGPEREIKLANPATPTPLTAQYLGATADNMIGSADWYLITLDHEGDRYTYLQSRTVHDGTFVLVSKKPIK